MKNYDIAWQRWNDMAKYSPASFHRRRIIIKIASQIKWETAIDIGCGNGLLLQEMACRFKGKSLSGADISEQIIEQNRTNYPQTKFYKLDIANEKLPYKYDLVIASEIIEHLADAKTGIYNLKQMCNNKIILTVPSGRLFPIDKEMGHARHFSQNELSRLLGECDLKVCAIWRWGFPFHVFYKYIINCFPSFFIKKFASSEYSPMSKIFSAFLVFLFYMNLKNFPISNQLIVCASVK